jgi:hypothetical protein
MPTESGSSGEHPAGASTSARESCTPDTTNGTQAGKIMGARVFFSLDLVSFTPKPHPVLLSDQ